MTHTCVTVRTSVARRVSWTISFEMDFSRTVSSGTGVPLSYDTYVCHSEDERCETGVLDDFL